MAIPSLPAPLDARFDADGFDCELRTKDALMPPWLVGPVAVLTVSASVLVSSCAGARLAHDLVGWIVLSGLATLMLVGGRALLDLLLAATHTVRMRCTHEALDVDLRVQGFRWRRLHVPLVDIERCRTTTEGLEIRYLVDGWSRKVSVPATCLGPELHQIAQEIERAAGRRRRFEAEQDRPEMRRARAAVERVLGQSESGKQKRLTAGR